MKNIRDITLADIAKSNVYNGVDFGKKRDKRELLKLLDRGNQLLKEHFIREEMMGVIHDYKKLDPEYNLITTDYFKNEIDKLTLIANRTVGPGPEETSKKDNWYFKGYMTSYPFLMFLLDQIGRAHV